MDKQTVASNSNALTPWQPGLWRFLISQDRRFITGVTDRSGDLDGLRTGLRRAWDGSPARGMVLAEQIHGASLAAVEMPDSPEEPITGCDGLTTRVPGLTLIVRTADCLPIVIWDPIQQVVGLIHAGWRGLVSDLPLRVISFVQRLYHSHPQDLWVGIGPAIRSCCYEVGKEFVERFGPFVREHHGRLTCDLIGCATQQLLASGVRPVRLVDSGQCTSCEATRWHSVRRDGDQGGRLLSFAMIRP